MKSNAKFLTFGALSLALLFFATTKVFAEYQIYSPGTPVTVGDFVYDDNFNPTTSPCSIIISDPSGNQVVNATTTGDSTGWHAYSFTPVPVSGSNSGVWPATLSCGSNPGGDLVREDRSFIVGFAAVDTTTISSTITNASSSIGSLIGGLNNVSTSSVANAIWNSPTRNLTNYATSSIADAVWTSPARTLTSFGTLVADISTAVWSNSSRTLTSFGTLVADITSSVWGNGTRTLTALGGAAADVWNNTFAPTRELTDQTLTNGGQLATQTDINNASSTIIAAVLNNSTLINNLNNVSASDVWAYGSRSLNGSGGTVDLTASSTQAIWDKATSGLTTSGSIGKLIATNLDATISSRGTSTSTLTAADIWTSATRTLTDYNTSTLASAVWTNAARTLTSYGNNLSAADVWNTLTSSMTTTGSIGAQFADLSTTTIATAVWNNPTRSLTDYATTSIATAIWTSPARTLTSFGTLVSDVTAAVWGNSTRTITALGSAAADVWNNTFTPTRELTDQTLTSGGKLATQTDVTNASSSIISAELNNATLINNLNNISAADVWAYGSRSLTGSVGTVDLSASSTKAIWDSATAGLTTTGSIGKLIATNLDTTISSRGTSTSTLTAADIWTAATRTLTDYSTSTVADAVWTGASRTLTSYGNNISAADVWNVMTSSMNTTGSIGAQVAGISTTTIASAVWNNPTRSLTDYATSSIASAIWTSPTRTLSSFGTLVSDITTSVWSNSTRTITALGGAAADVWSNSFAPNREITDQTLTSGGKLATQADIANATSSIITEVINNRNLINGLNNISASDVWTYGARSLNGSGGTVDLTATSTKAIWDIAKSNLTTTGSVGKLIADNLDATISSRSTSTLTAADIWNTSIRTLTDYSTTSLATAVWANSARTLTNYGNDITAADVWNTLNSTLTTTGSIGAQLAQTNTSTITTAIWNAPSRTLTDYATTTIANAIWSSPSRSLTSFGTLVSDITTSVWSNSTRTITALGSAAADVWNGAFAPSRELTDQTLTSGGKLATQADIASATSSIITEVVANKTLINNLNNISAADVWAYGSRSLTGSVGTVDLSASSTKAIWDVAKANLTTGGSIGQLIANNLDATISSRSSSTLTAADIWTSATRTLSDYATNTLATAVWSNGTRTLTNYGNNITAADVWNTLNSTLTTSGSIGQQLASLSTSTISTAVWNNPTRNLTDYATSSIASAIWTSPTRTLSSFGTLASDVATAVWGNSTRTITALGGAAADVWNNSFAPTRTLTSSSLASGQLATQADVISASSTIMSAILNNSQLISNLNNISASDVWAYGSRNLTGSVGTVDLSASSTLAIWNVAKSNLTTTGSVGKLIADNLDATISSRGTANLTAADVWTAATRTLTDYSTSTVASAVWSNAARTLTNYGNNLSAADVWNTLTSTLTTTGSIGQQITGTLNTTTLASAIWTNPVRTLTNNGNDITAADVWNYISHTNSSGNWVVNMTDTQQVPAGTNYLVTVHTTNAGTQQNSLSAPQITIYDVNHNVVISNADMVNTAAGTYTYSYSVDNNAPQGYWESVINTNVTGSQYITTSDYWQVLAAPAQVIINNVSGTTVPNISADITITNEGNGGYEYAYEWCVVSSLSNPCGGGDDVFYASAAKYILPGQNFNTTLTATVPNPGNYYFRVIAYFGTKSSSSSRSFTATAAVSPTPTPASGGGGAGGAGPIITNSPTPTSTDNWLSADLNQDGYVNSTDFSILLYFWHTKPPFTNPRVDINKDGKVDSIDFSIMLFQWTGNRKYK